MGHRVAPDLLVDLLPLDHLARHLSQKLEELEFPTRQLKALSADERLELIAAYLQLGMRHRPDLKPDLGALSPTDDGFDPRHHLFRMAGLADPIVRPESEGANPLRDGRLRGADEHAEAGDRAADLLQEIPALWTQDGEVDQHSVQLHRQQVLDRQTAAEHAMLPRRPVQALLQDG